MNITTFADVTLPGGNLPATVFTDVQIGSIEIVLALLVLALPTIRMRFNKAYRPTWLVLIPAVPAFSCIADGLQRVGLLKALAGTVGTDSLIQWSWMIIAGAVGGIYALLRSQSLTRVQLAGMSEQMVGLKEVIADARATIEAVKSTSLEDLKLATHTVATALSLRADPEIKENFSSTVGKFYQALGSAVDEWRITANQVNAFPTPGNHLQLREVILRLGACYLRQEATAAQGKYVTTSGRNYVEMLITTLDELLRQIPSDSNLKLHYRAVTSASPLDFYNWPHLGINGHGRWEAEYLCFFRRTLHAIIHDPDVKSKIKHSRIVIAADDETARKHALSMAWELSLAGQIQSDLEAKIFPFPLTCPENITACIPSSAAANLFHFFHFFNAEKKQVFPVFGPKLHERWLPSGAEGESLRTVAGQNISALEGLMDGPIEWNCNNSSALNIMAHVDAARESCMGQMNTLLAELQTELGANCPAEFAEFSHSLSIGNGTLAPVAQIFSHWSRLRSALPLKRLDAQVFARSLKRIEDAILHHLAVREADRIKTNYKDAHISLNDWPTVGDVFAHDWHSNASEFFTASLNVAKLNDAAEKKVWQEFALFGIGEDDAEPTWAFGLATDLEYPFDYERVDFLIPESGNSNNPLQHYVDWMNSLEKTSVYPHA